MAEEFVASASTVGIGIGIGIWFGWGCCCCCCTCCCCCCCCFPCPWAAAGIASKNGIRNLTGGSNSIFKTELLFVPISWRAWSRSFFINVGHVFTITYCSVILYHGFVCFSSLTNVCLHFCLRFHLSFSCLFTFSVPSEGQRIESEVKIWMRETFFTVDPTWIFLLVLQAGLSSPPLPWQVNWVSIWLSFQAYRLPLTFGMGWETALLDQLRAEKGVRSPKQITADCHRLAAPVIARARVLISQQLPPGRRASMLALSSGNLPGCLPADCWETCLALPAALSSQQWEKISHSTTFCGAKRRVRGKK